MKRKWVKKRSISVALWVAIGAFVLSPSASPGASPVGEFRIAVPTLETEILGPVMGTIDCKWYQTLLYDELVGIEPPSTDFSTKTGIAYRWESSPDYKDWTFYLRKGVKFHNGDEVTAKDVKYTLDRALGPVGMSNNKATLTNTIDSVEVIDDYTICIHCKGPDTMIPCYMSEHTGTEAMIVPKKYIEENGDEYFRSHPIGTGPYKLKEYVPGAHMLFEAVDEHWALGVPKYKYVRLMIVPEATARIGLLQRGDVDMISLPRERVAEVKATGLPIVQDPSQGTTLLFFYETWDKDYPISDIRVREALNISIDREAVLQTLFAGMGELAPWVFATPASIGYEPALPPYPYDPKRAKALLKEAGYGPGNPCKIPVYSFPMVAFPEGERFIEVAAGSWEEVGFDIKIIKVPEYGTFKKKWTEHVTKGAVAPNTVGGRVWSIPVTNIICHTGVMFSTAEIPELDKAVEEALAAVNAEDRAILANKVFRKIYEEYLHLPLINAPGCFAVNPKTVPDSQDWHMGVTTWDYNLEWVLFPR